MTLFSKEKFSENFWKTLGIAMHRALPYFIMIIIKKKFEQNRYKTLREKLCRKSFFLSGQSPKIFLFFVFFQYIGFKSGRSLFYIFFKDYFRKE